MFILFTIEGNPVPDVSWHKGFKDLNMEPRYKTWTDSSSGVNQVILGIKECRQEEEGDYKCVLKTKEHGEVEFEFKLFVTVEGGMDFR